MALEVVIASLILLATTLIIYFKYKYSYWKRKRIPHLEPTIPFGNFQNSYKKTTSFGVQIKQLYFNLKKLGSKHGGAYLLSNPVYIPLDLEVIKRILTKDFNNFTDRGLYVSKSDPLSAHLIALSGEKWRLLRNKITPSFTPNKLKTMFPILLECSRSLEEAMDKLVTSGLPIDIKEVVSRFGIDVIGSCAFGLEFNSIKEEDSLFRKHSKAIFEKSKMRALKTTMAVSFPRLAGLLGIKLIPEDTAEFFLKLVGDTVKYREESGFNRKDFMQLLIDLKKDDEDFRLSNEDIAAQCFVFFLAGYETASATTSFVLYELSNNEEIQERVRREILQECEQGITYEALNCLKYLDQVIDEAMRMYPALPFMSRKCAKSCDLEGFNIEEGTRCIISVLGLHYDEDYFQEPGTFNPDRFSRENAQKIPQYAFLPFGDGPRNCIGSRFGLLQTKIALVVLLSKYKFRVNSLTQQPLEMSPKSMILTVKNGIWLDADSL